MTDILDFNSSTFTINSFAESRRPIGVNRTKPAFQFVYADAPVHDWQLRDGKLIIGGYSYIGVLEGKVIASIHSEQGAAWRIINREPQNGYTIALENHPHLGWTVPLNPEEKQVIEIRTIIATASEPPQFLQSQLFSLRKVD